MLGFFKAADLTFYDDFEGTTLPWIGNTVVTGAPANKIRNSRFVTPVGPYPQYWAVSSPAGTAASIVGTGNVTLDGQSVPYVDFRVTGTATASGNALISLDTTSIVIASGQTWTMSGYCALQGGTLTNVSNIQWGLEYYRTDGTTWENGAYPQIGTPTSTLARTTQSVATTALSARGLPIFAFFISAGAVDVTFRLAGPQAEQASSASALVQTQPGDELVQTQSRPGKWYSRYPWGEGTIINNEQAYFPDVRVDGTSKSGGTNPFGVAGSVLTITARATPGGAVTAQPYVSGAMSTAGGGPPGGPFSFSQKYGYFECRARCTAGQGLWPGFWLMPAANMPGGTTSGEIDILEWIGGANYYAATVHYSGQMHQDFVPFSAGGMQAFHTYGVDWREDKIAYYYDRKPALNGSGVHVVHQTEPEQRVPYCVLLNLAVGGSWPGPINNTGQIPAKYEVDYVRVWDKLPF